ncbi:MAG: hypothetical protein ACTHPS_23920 [Streptosporangiaceae bacterium]
MSADRAALIYQHATKERDEAIATTMGQLFAPARRKGPAKVSIGHDGSAACLDPESRRRRQLR